MSDTKKHSTQGPQISLRTEYSWEGSAPAHNHTFLLPALTKILFPGRGRTLIDMGCGNGSLTTKFAEMGYRPTGIDVAASGIKHAKDAHPSIMFTEHNLDQPLPAPLHQGFNVAVSAEVIEHMLLPRELFRRADEALVPGGLLVLTTPFHGWLKNVALAVTNGMDQHWSPAWDYGHIKFFSRRTLASLADECGYREISFHRVGRIPPLAMSMIATFRKHA